MLIIYVKGLAKKERFKKLSNIARYQKEILDKQDFLKSLKKTSGDIYLDPTISKELPEQ